jgi:hypothetical protein
MLDRQKVEAVLSRRFPGSARQQIAAATNAIMGLSDEWEEVGTGDLPGGEHIAEDCIGRCYLADTGLRGAEFRIFKRRDH